ncbi:MAG: hypothetical protein HZA63_17400 [Rhodocyclales bacterium]|nr:hypothetical protein [Rhodocyclales bacterium]
MADCCSTPATGSDHPRKQRCPGNGAECAEVSPRTIAHHIAAPWTWTPTASRWFHCADPACEVLYFDDEGSTIPRSRLRIRAAVDASGDRPLCHCFGLTPDDFLRDPATRDYVVAQTRAGLCSCETSNPSGRCCLKDFPEIGGGGR